MKNILVSIVIPVLNEEKAIARCVEQVKGKRYKVKGKNVTTEIIVVDNGSTDRSREAAKKAGAKVVVEPKKGYGRALLTGLEKAKGDYLIFADGDGSYDFSEVPGLLNELVPLEMNQIRNRSRSVFFEQEIRPPSFSALVHWLFEKYGHRHDVRKKRLSTSSLLNLTNSVRNGNHSSLPPVFFDRHPFLAESVLHPGGVPSRSFAHPRGVNCDIVVGSRLKGKIQKGAMPFSHRYLGTPFLNFLFKVFFGQNFSDVNSGFRGMTKKAFNKLKLKSTGMEFASEMLYKAGKLGLNISEVPISYKKRVGKSKLSLFRDAWRHVKFLLLFSPTWLFLVPGGILGVVGMLGVLILSLGPIYVFGRTIDIHTMMTSSFMTLIGFQIIFLGLFARVFAQNFLMEEDEKIENLLKRITLEKGIIFGMVLFLIGISGFTFIVVSWFKNNFGSLSMERLLLFSLTFIVLGLGTIFSSFFFGIIAKEER